MAQTEVERVRCLLDKLERHQRQRKGAADTQAAPLRLHLQEEEHASSPCKGRRVLCELLAGEPHNGDAATPTAAHALEIPASARRVFASGRQTFEDMADFEAYARTALEQAAFERACSKLSARERPSKDVFNLLVQEGYPAEASQAAVDKAKRCGVICDTRYVQAFVNSKTRAGWGKARISRELERFGLSLEDAGDVALDGLTQDREYERALAAASRRAIPSKNPTEKIARFLMGRGFAMGLSLRVAKEVVAQAQDPSDE